MSDQENKYFIYARKSSDSEDRQVASIPSQLDELRQIAEKNNLRVVDVFTEEMTAKKPGRPVFGRMLAEIRSGRANGLICWKLDRLARNPVDGGGINWLLQSSVIRHIITFERSYYPTDNTLMMSLEFGMANQFILDLSANTKRGMRAKVQTGWFPHIAPLGYLNNKYCKPDLPQIYKDPDKFPIIKKLWSVLLEKRVTTEHLFEIARDMGLTGRRGQPIPRHDVYVMFRNSFYTGSFQWKGQLYPGKHEPMITQEDFDLAQQIITARSHPTKSKLVVAFRGLIRCGRCDSGITAQRKTKRLKNGEVHHYTYYHCSQHRDKNCAEPYIRTDRLENLIAEVLGGLSIPPEFHQWAVGQLKSSHTQEMNGRTDIMRSYRHQLDACVKKLDMLLDLRLNGEIVADEYAERKEELLKAKAKYEILIDDAGKRVETWIDRAEGIMDFAAKAQERFWEATIEVKSRILACLGTNLKLRDGKLELSVENGLAFLQKAALQNRDSGHIEPSYVDNFQGDSGNVYALEGKWGG